ncbi:putative E3 ubiquitin-protein ligase RHG1A isoform X2 [Wolffia australiana]
MPITHVTRTVRGNGFTVAMTITITSTSEAGVFDIVDEVVVPATRAAPLTTAHAAQPRRPAPHEGFLVGSILCGGNAQEDVPRRLSTRSYVQSRNKEHCIVCLEEYKEGEEVAVLQCSHLFHPNCISTWLMHRNVCPICMRVA